jgi:hypothetical protein
MNGTLAAPGYLRGKGNARFSCSYRFLLAVVTALFVAGRVAAQPTVDLAHLITPGVGIGPLKLVMTISDATALIGVPNPGQTFQGAVLPTPDGAIAYFWQISGFHAEVDRATVIYDIGISEDPLYATPDGLHAGLTLAATRAKWGSPSRTGRSGSIEWFAYDSRGLLFFVSRDSGSPWNGKVIRIDVYSPGKP